MQGSHVFFCGLVAMALLVGCDSGKEKSPPPLPSASEPRVMLLVYYNYPEVFENYESIVAEPISNLPTMAEMKGKPLSLATSYGITFSDKPWRSVYFQAVRSRKEGQTEYLDMRVTQNLVVTELKDVAYNGEQFLPICHGDDWMLVLGTENFLDEENQLDFMKPLASNGDDGDKRRKEENSP